MEIKIEICQGILETLISNRLAPREDTIQDELVELAGGDDCYMVHAQFLARHGLIKLNVKRGAKSFVYLGAPVITPLGIAASKTKEKLLKYFRG